MNVNEVKKDLYKSKVNAKFSHYAEGKLFYTVKLNDGNYMFPIKTIETDYIEPLNEGEDEREIIILSSDLGSTPFNSEMRASELNRWVAKSIEKNEFIKII